MKQSTIKNQYNMKPKSEITPREYLIYTLISKGHVEEEAKQAVNLLIHFLCNKTNHNHKEEEFDSKIGDSFPALYLEIYSMMIYPNCLADGFCFSTYEVVFGEYTVKYKKLTPQEAKESGWVEDTEPDHLFLNELLGFTEEEKSIYSSNKSWSLSTPEVGSIILHRGTDSMDGEVIRKSKYFFGKIIEVLEN